MDQETRDALFYTIITPIFSPCAQCGEPGCCNQCLLTDTPRMWNKAEVQLLLMECTNEELVCKGRQGRPCESPIPLARMPEGACCYLCETEETRQLARVIL